MKGMSRGWRSGAEERCRGVSISGSVMEKKTSQNKPRPQTSTSATWGWGNGLVGGFEVISVLG